MLLTATLLVGALTMAGLIVLVGAFRRPLPHLGETLNALDHLDIVTDARPGTDDLSDGSGLERVGSWVLRTAKITPPRRLEARLRLRGVTAARLYGEQTAFALVVPVMLLSLIMLVNVFVPIDLVLTAGTVLAGVAAGWLLPRFLMSAGAASTNADANEALLVYIDLVILERLADRHIRDALTTAAACSDNPLFRQIRVALDRAQLAQEQPWTELARLAEQLNLPALNDVADIARLQQHGVSLNASLRARAAELRNAHVVIRQQESDRVTARMELWRTFPVMMVVVLFAAPPLLRLMAGG